MDEATARDVNRRRRGRRRLRIGSLALSSLMTMHCRLPSSALTGGLFFFMVFLICAVAALANPVRHFEVYLGQWSICGPGRAFRIVPMLDGIGMAMCINAIVRAITCATTAAVATSYVVDSAADAQLPFTYCRNFDLKPYTPPLRNIQTFEHGLRKTIEKNGTELEITTVGLSLKHKAWRNASYIKRIIYHFPNKIKVCNETYAGTYPPMYTTPAYNYFYVEVTKFRNFESVLGQFNVRLGVAIVVAWLVLWMFIVIEKLSFGRLIYNNIKPWLILVPWVWCVMLIVQSASNLTMAQNVRQVFKLGNTKETISALADAFEVSLYIHSLSVGTELIHGKALHRYEPSHIDPNLNGENVWHSAIVLMLAGLHTSGAAMCAVVDYKHFNPTHDHDPMKESTLWIMPMYSKCTSMGEYSHLMSAAIFGGLVFSYMVVAFLLLKTVLHTIFEYCVRLIFVEQVVVGALIICCMGLSLIYATEGGIALLESVDALMTGIGMSFVVFMELICLLHVYRNEDFKSEMRQATEENTCAPRIAIQWRLVPFITMIAIGLKLIALTDAEMGSKYMGWATIPLVALVLALPLRSAFNAFKYMRQKAQTT